MLILGLETSCDETAAAVLVGENNPALLSSVVSSQVKLHAKWGGVVPNLAAREHLKNIRPAIKSALKEAGVTPRDIDLIAVTNGPGLIPALLVGTTAAKTLSYLWRVPLVGIHHIEGHIYANFISDKIGVSTKSQIRNPKQIKNLKSNISNLKFPLLCLVVSGGHTQLVLMKKHLDYEIIGETLDDASGEAFDKVARILGLGYPGGPEISKMAEKSNIVNLKSKIILPRPMLNSKDFNFSFSGLKTAVLYLAKKNEKLLTDKKFTAAVSREFQQAVCDVLVAKTIAAAKKFHPKTIMLAGGVSANLELRRQLGEKIKNDLPNTRYQIPDTEYSLDNAAMIAAAAYYRYALAPDKKIFADNWKKLDTDANLKLSS
jgi:N6-L-threonylcarbamoyladenine synthase